jgi:hypothetical protein
MIVGHLRIDSDRFKQLCMATVQEFLESKLEKSSLNRLYKLSALSTSPFLHTEAALQGWIEANMQEVLSDNELFLRKYILPSFVTLTWDAQGDGGVSEPVSCWRLYVQTLACRIKERPELPPQILEEQIDESLQLFTSYFGELQPCKSRAIAMRANLFLIVGTIGQIHPSTLPSETLSRAWYLLYIAAISGAMDGEIRDCKPDPATKETSLFLGLDVTQSEFCSYPTALGKLSKKFESEFARFPGMASFIRANY